MLHLDHYKLWDSWKGNTTTIDSQVRKEGYETHKIEEGCWASNANLRKNLNHTNKINQQKHKFLVKKRYLIKYILKNYYKTQYFLGIKKIF